MEAPPNRDLWVELVPDIGLGPNPCKEWCVRFIPTTQGFKALVSGEDFVRTSKYAWQACPKSNTVYVQRGIKIYFKDKSREQRTQQLHRFIIGGNSYSIDHRDRNGLNNTRSNLRGCTQSINMHNSNRSDPGITWDSKRRRFRVRLVIDRVEIFLGRYKSLHKAREVVQNARVKWKLTSND